MAINYDKFKTPFYEIQISNRAGNSTVTLPHYILRLLERIEIFETLEYSDHSALTLTFVEGSREPASPHSGGANSLYPLDFEMKSSITNSSGILTDLKFGGNFGITYLSNSEQQYGVQQTIEYDIDPSGKNNVIKFVDKPPETTFLFQEGNTITLTFGYKEDPATVRTIPYVISVIKVTYPDSGQITTTLTCLDKSAFYNQKAPIKGIPQVDVEGGSSGGVLVDFNDTDTTKLLINFCTKMGIDYIISKDVAFQKLDQGHVKVQLGGTSFYQFLRELARDSNAYVKIIKHSSTGKDTLIFANKNDLDKELIVTDTNLFNYKHPGSIIKSINIVADFTKVLGNTQASASNKNIASGSQSTDNPGVNTVMFEGENQGLVGFKEIDDKLKNVFPSGLTGSMEVVPFDNNAVKLARAQSEVNLPENRILQIDMDLIGYTGIIPGTIEVNGIGARFSGKFRILSVRHQIDASGYSTRVIATSLSLPQGGTIPEAKKGETPASSVPVQLFESAESNQNDDVTSNVASNTNSMVSAYKAANGVKNVSRQGRL